MRLLHTMLRVTDLERSIAFYTDKLGMKVLRKQDYPSGEFTLAFIGYGDEATHTVLELTYNWDQRTYQQGDAYGHVAIGVDDIYGLVEKMKQDGIKVNKEPSPMKFGGKEVIAFVEDPDGYAIELIQKK